MSFFVAAMMTSNFDESSLFDEHSAQSEVESQRALFALVWIAGIPFRGARNRVKCFAHATVADNPTNKKNLCRVCPREP